MRERRQSFTIYSLSRRGWPYISFLYRFNTGWQSSKRIKHGLVYNEPAILIGRIYTNKSKWIRLGHWVWPDYLTIGHHKYKRQHKRERELNVGVSNPSKA